VSYLVSDWYNLHCRTPG